MKIVDRKEELSILRRAVRAKMKVLIKGLRGVGKTTLLRIITSEYNGLYINCQKILKPNHLLSFLPEEKSISDAYESLELLFHTSERKYPVLALDEFTDLLKRFGNFKPYKGSGGIEAVASHFRALLEECKICVILSTTSLKTLIRVAGEYSKPLARAFDVVIHLHPLKFDDAIELARKECEKLGITISKEALNAIAEFTGGNPDYIKALIRVLPQEVSSPRIVQETFLKELKEGYFNILFSGLQRELSIGETEILYLVSRGFTKYSEIEKRAEGINVNLSLRSLISRGLIEKIKLNKEAHYVITDKTMGVWFALEPYPGLEALEFEKARLIHLSFESLIRELFMHIRREIQINDVLGRKLIISPVIKVYKYHGKLGEVDLIARTRQGSYVGEVYFGRKCPPEKVKQIERAIAITETLGENVIGALLISYFGFQDETFEEMNKSLVKERLYLLDKHSIRHIARLVGYREI